MYVTRVSLIVKLWCYFYYTTENSNDDGLTESSSCCISQTNWEIYGGHIDTRLDMNTSLYKVNSSMLKVDRKYWLYANGASVNI